VSPEKDVVAQSFGRCCASEKFFDDFYETFLKSSPRAKEKFKDVDMARQKGLLRDAIAFMVMFFDGSSVATAKVDKLASSHSRARLNIEPDLYKFWLESLLVTVARHDARFGPEQDRAWRAVMGKGIAALVAGYARTSAA
jgi:hemoglobin-like flavoprotein